jgi:hypothetical protein
VTVRFLNDAYGGSPAADRNLYVNAISYDGTATGQSTALFWNGTQSFSVTDNTAPPAMQFLQAPVAPAVAAASSSALAEDASTLLASFGSGTAADFTTGPSGGQDLAGALSAPAYSAACAALPNSLVDIPYAVPDVSALRVV